MSYDHIHPRCHREITKAEQEEIITALQGAGLSHEDACIVESCIYAYHDKEALQMARNQKALYIISIHFDWSASSHFHFKYWNDLFNSLLPRQKAIDLLNGTPENYSKPIPF